MLRRLLHAAVAHPRVYDLVQDLAGSRTVRNRLALRVGPGRPGLVLDLGGGTGTVSVLFRSPSSYVCLDLDPLKLAGFRARRPGGLCLLADASRLPLPARSVDTVVSTFLGHHLADGLLARTLGEVARVLKPGGRFFFVDPIANPHRRISRALWWGDRGSHPRSAEDLRAFIERSLRIDSWEQFAVFHEYVLCVASPR